jgi:hypothetical protein
MSKKEKIEKTDEKKKDGRGQHTKKGGHEPWKKSPVIMHHAYLDEMPKDEARQLVSQTLADTYKWYKMPRVETDDECEERLIMFFETCIATGELPTIEKMSLALGVVTETVRRWERGDLGSRRSAMIKKAKEFIATYDAEMAHKGKMQPVTYIFRAKNYYGMRDTVDYNLSSADPLGESSSREEIEQRIKNSIPLEDYDVDNED